MPAYRTIKYRGWKITLSHSADRRYPTQWKARIRRSFLSGRTSTEGPSAESVLRDSKRLVDELADAPRAFREERASAEPQPTQET